MVVACVLSAHSHPETVLDTLDSVLTYMTKDVLVLIDGSSDLFRDRQIPAHRVYGLPHGLPRSLYRNTALGYKSAVELFPDADWYCQIEYDCLVGNDRFRGSLERADEKDVWILGNDGHVDTEPLGLIGGLVGGDLLPNSYYLLGACQFLSRKFMETLLEHDFFDRFLFLTADFPGPDFPGYRGYDLSEHM